MRMALPKEMELLDLDQFEANKAAKSPSRKFAKKKQSGKRNGFDGGEVGLMLFSKVASTVV